MTQAEPNLNRKPIFPKFPGRHPCKNDGVIETMLQWRLLVSNPWGRIGFDGYCEAGKGMPGSQIPVKH